MSEGIYPLNAEAGKTMQSLQQLQKYHGRFRIGCRSLLAGDAWLSHDELACKQAPTSGNDKS
jgi:hypothetical protein